MAFNWRVPLSIHSSTRPGRWLVDTLDRTSGVLPSSTWPKWVRLLSAHPHASLLTRELQAINVILQLASFGAFLIARFPFSLIDRWQFSPCSFPSSFLFDKPRPIGRSHISVLSRSQSAAFFRFCLGNDQTKLGPWTGKEQPH